MTDGREVIERLLLAVAGEVEGPESPSKAIARLRNHSLDPTQIVWLMETIENHDKPTSLRRYAIQTLGFHQPWRSLSLFLDSRIQKIPDRLGLIVENQSEHIAVRDAALSAIGWQYLSEKQLWPKLLADPDPYLRQNALFELLRDPDRETVEMVLRHLCVETEPHVRDAVLWGLGRHPHFFEVALALLARTGGTVFIHTVTEACSADLVEATRGLLNADMKYFEVREALLQRLFETMDEPRITCLLSLTQEGRTGFALRRLRAVDDQTAGMILTELDRTVHRERSVEWTEEAAKLLLFYWDRFDSLHSSLENLLRTWQRSCPKVSHLAMSRGILLP